MFWERVVDLYEVWRQGKVRAIAEGGHVAFAHAVAEISVSIMVAAATAYRPRESEIMVSEMKAHIDELSGRDGYLPYVE